MSQSLPIPSWLAIKTHAEGRIEAARDALEAAAAADLPALQAEIRVWRQVVDLPAVLADDPVAPDAAGYS